MDLLIKINECREQYKTLVFYPVLQRAMVMKNNNSSCSKGQYYPFYVGKL